MMLSFVLAAAGIGWFQAEVSPTESELRRARQVLMGPWTIAAATDDGESIGPELVRSRMVKDGRIVVDVRTMTYSVPGSGEKHVVGYKINPAKLPREIDLVSVDERMLPGIYKIEGEQLVVCLADGRDPVRPADFESKPGSARLLLRLDHASGAAATVAPEEREAEDAVVMQGESPVPVGPTSGRNRATAQEIARDRSLLAGAWEIVSIDEDGESLGPALIRRKLALNGRVRFGSRGITVTSPVDDARRFWAYRIDPAGNPREIDVVTDHDSILKGIYVFDRDTLSICLARSEDASRPVAFAAPSGSGHVLYRFKVAPSDPTPAPAPEPTPEELKAMREEKVREMLAGSWSIRDDRGTLVTVIRPDGTFSSTRTLARPRLLSPGVISHGGTWSYAAGVFSARITSTTDPNMLGYSFTNRVQSISPTSMVMGGGLGPLKTYRKL